jgi:hypothetical protein
MDTVTTPVHWAGYGANVSRQILDWAVDAQRRIEEVFADICNTTLEAALIADLLTAAGTPAADLDTAEATAGTAWGSTVDTIIVNPGDWPAVRRTYAPQPVPFGNVCVTASIAAGTALVLPLGGVWLLAERMQLLSQVEPSRLGSAIVATRGGVVAERRTGVVAAATLATVNP